MDIIEMTRELGKAIQQDERYVAYTLAKIANDNDAELQTLINDFDKKRTSLNEELSKEDKNTDMIKALDEDIKDVYSRIMSNQNMMIFNGAKNALEQLISEVNQIVTMCANGEDPDTCQVSHGCSGSCSTCGGCH